MKRTGIKRKTRLKQGGTLKRGEIKTRKPKDAKPSKPRKRLKQQSAKRTAENEVRREMLEELVRVRGDGCEAGERVFVFLADQPGERGGYEGCALTACDGHEKHPRSQGGSPTDPANVLLVCRPCHDWTHAHPKAARSLGLLGSVTSSGTPEQGGNYGSGDRDGGIVDATPTDLRRLGDDGRSGSLVRIS